MIRSSDATKAEDRQSKTTLTRLANSRARVAARRAEVTLIAADLNAQDFKIIAEILHGLAAAIPE